MSEQDDAMPAGTAFGTYQIVRVLGRGAFGVVYEALRQPLGKRVALKVLHRKFVTQHEALHRFLREAQMTAQIQHPHIVDTFDIGQFEGAPYLAMEFLEGEPLSRRLKRETRIPMEQAVDLMLPVLSAMYTVHERGVVHRDLKPENIFLVRVRGGGVNPKVLDFGIAKVSGAEGDAALSLTNTSALLGTPYYMSPEQARESKHIDPRSDQWTLGVILYECVIGRRPFAGNSLLELLNRIASAEYAPVRRLMPELPEGFETALATMLQRDPDARFADLRAAGLALLPFASAAARTDWSDEFHGRLTVAPAETLDAIDDAVASGIAATAMASSANNISARASVRPAFVATGPQDIEIFSNSANSSSGTHGASLRARTSDLATSATLAASTAPAGAAPGTLSLSARETPVAPLAPPVAAPSRRWIIPAVATAVCALVVGGWFAMRPRETAAANSAAAQRTVFHVITRVDPPGAAISLDQEAPVTGSIDRALPIDGRIHRLVVSAPGYRRAEFSFRDHFASPEIVLVPDTQRPAAAPDAAAADAAPTAVTDASAAPVNAVDDASVAPAAPVVDAGADEAPNARRRRHHGSHRRRHEDAP